MPCFSAGKQPNATFWPYVDSATGEKRMCVKTTAPVAAGQELLVDYGKRYFEQEASDSQADSDSASDYERERSRPAKRRATQSDAAAKQRNSQPRGSPSAAEQ